MTIWNEILKLFLVAAQAVGDFYFYFPPEIVCWLRYDPIILDRQQNSVRL